MLSNLCVELLSKDNKWYWHYKVHQSGTMNYSSSARETSWALHSGGADYLLKCDPLWRCWWSPRSVQRLGFNFMLQCDARYKLTSLEWQRFGNSWYTIFIIRRLSVCLYYLSIFALLWRVFVFRWRGCPVRVSAAAGVVLAPASPGAKGGAGPPVACSLIVSLEKNPRARRNSH